MTTIAKGSFPGRPRKKLHKRKVKFQKKFHKNDLGHLGLACSYISHVTEQFHAIFDDKSEKDVEFIGFSSEECGLRAYKRVSKRQAEPSPSAADILGSDQTPLEKDKVITRRAHALDQSTSSSLSQTISSPSNSLSGSPLKNDSFHSRSTDASASSSDSAFLKYKNFKLDFHRLSKKAKNRTSHEDCSAEEQSKRKDASTASLKYASDIYLAKNHTVLGHAKSPIKPATFIPPSSHSVMHSSPTGRTSLKIKKGVRLKGDNQEQKKGCGHPEVIAKALLARANRDRKPEGNYSPSRFPQSKNKRPKSPRGFVLPMKSVRSARIIKANRKYMDEDSIRQIDDRALTPCEDIGDVDPPNSVASSDSAIVPLEDSDEGKENLETEDVCSSLSIDDSINAVSVKLENPKRSNRKPLIKEPTFCIRDTKRNASPSRRTHKSRKGGYGSTVAQVRSRCVIKRARFKHPTSSDALLRGPDHTKDRQPHQVAKNPIRPPTFTTPTTKKSDHPIKPPDTPPPSSPTRPEPELSDLGLSPQIWRKLSDASHRKWVVGSCERIIPTWTVQEIHNLLHGAHTFGGAWCSIARQYDFHELHRDANSVSMKGKMCQKAHLLNDSYKVKSSILLQLKPKLSDDPNVTVFTPKELSVRGMTSNVPFNYNTDKQRQRYFFNTTAERIEERKKELAQKLIESASEDFKHTTVQLEDISQSDLCLGLPESTMTMMLRPKHANEQRKVPWAHWEVHNILHGIHYFGVGSWAQISAMYMFLATHDNIAIRGKFKSVCCRDLIVAREVRPDVLQKLHIVLSPKGKAYFYRNKVSVNICGLPKSEKTITPRGSPQMIDRTTRKTRRKRRTRGRPRHSSFGSVDSDSDQMPVSPRRRTVHLFGTVPLWDEAEHGDAIDSNSDIEADASKDTPVLKALEDGLRRNMTSPVTKSSTVSSSDYSFASPSQPSSVDAKTKTNSETKIQKPSNQRPRSASKDKPRPVTKRKGRGPRIKHVCRRASLVTGETRATLDQSPHLTALPRHEREKIAAQAEKSKVNGAPSTMSSSDSDDVRNHHSKPANPTTARKEKQLRKRNLNHRCGTCDACKEPPCKACDGCRNPVSVPGTWNCFTRDPCTNPITHEPVTQTKRCKKNHPEHQPASRKSSRLMQQRVPLKSVQIEDTSFLNVNSTVTCHATNSDSLAASFPGLSPPGCENDLFGTLNRRNEALIKVDDWKDTYDLDLLWKCGGHALIASDPSPPQTVCFLCGSRGLPDDETDALVFCSSCCEPFHGYCADDNFDQSNVKKAMKNGTWLCRRCQYCQVCGHPDDLLACRQCKKTYHFNCLGPSYPIKPSAAKSWVCLQCVRCSSCGSSKPGNLPGSKWTHDCTMCQRCGDLFDQGNYCTICRKCYRDEDYECRMMQCASCKRWIHSKCESLTVEMYTILTHMPDSVQYECPDCDERGEKLRGEFGDDFLKKDQKNFPCDLEKVRLFINKLPDPPWKKAIQEETQSGLEAIIMGLFHHKATYCILKKNETPSGSSSNTDNTDLAADLSRPRDLFAVRFAVHNRRYRSVGAFCSDILIVLSSLQDVPDRSAVEKAFREEASAVFSWFNFEAGKVRDSDDLPDDLLPDAILPPFPEHDYAQCLDKDIRLPGGTPNPSPVKSCLSTPSCISESLSSPLKESEDLRQCLFCSKYGDGKAVECGRLLYCGQDEWCHVSCALWSAEVYEQHDGSLENVHSAVSRGKMLKCDNCRLPGATVGCNTRDCPKNYHLMCARNAKCAFQEDKKIFCARHLHHAKNSIGDDGFVVERLVCVDNDEMRPNRRWQRGILACSISVSIGSLTVHQLGKLGYASDSRECLTPISYSMSRVFWSTFHVNRKAVYTITVMEQKPSDGDNLVDGGSADHTNMTISHSNQDEDHTAKHHSKQETSSLASPPHLCRTDLMKRLKERSGIGPLSGRSMRNSSNQPFSSDHRAKAAPGTYTIVSNINKTLPQAITPLPPHPHPSSSVSFLDSKNQDSPPESKDKDETLISFENPFLNKTSLQPTPTNPNKDESIQAPIASDMSIAPVFSDSLLAKLAKPEANVKATNLVLALNTSSTFSANTVSGCSTKSPEITSFGFIPTSSGVASADCSPPEFTMLANSTSIPLGNEAKSEVPVPCAPKLQVGASGALLSNFANQVQKNESCVSTNGASEPCQTFTTHNAIVCEPKIRPDLSKASVNQSNLSKTTLNDLLDRTDGVKEIECKKTFIVEETTSPKRDPIACGKKKTIPVPTPLKELNTDNVSSFDGLSQLPPPIPTLVNKSIAVSVSTPVISLIQDARLITDMESKEETKTSKDESPSLWWHKRDTKSLKVHKVKSGHDFTSKNTNSSKLDPSYAAPSSEQHLWKKKNGESSLDVAHRNRKRVTGKRVCKDFENVYLEVSTDTEDETETSSPPNNRTNFRPKKQSPPPKERKGNTSVETLKRHIVSSGQAVLRIETETKKKHSSSSQTQQSNSTSKLLCDDPNNGLKLTAKEEKVPDFAEFDTLDLQTRNITGASSALKEVDSEMSSSSLELSETDSLCNFNTSMVSLEEKSAGSLHESSCTKSCLAERNADCSNNNDLSCINNKTYSSIDSEGGSSRHTSSGLKPSNTTSDDEMAASLSPTTKLRRFALKSPKNGAPKTEKMKKGAICHQDKERLRSKSHDAPLISSSSPKKVVLPLIPEVSLEIRLERCENSPVASGARSTSLKGLHLLEASGNKNDDVTARRYPRRDTYTCLKSFSGLSPNYALASYSRKGKMFERPNKVKRNTKKDDILLASTAKKVSADVKNTDSRKPLHDSTTNKSSDIITRSKNLKIIQNSHRPEQDPPIPASPDVNQGLFVGTSTDVASDVKKTIARANVSPDLDQEQTQEPDEPQNQVSSDKGSSKESCAGSLSDEEKANQNEKPSPQEVLSSSTTLPGFVNVQDKEKDIVDDVLDSLEINLEPKDKHVDNLSFSPSEDAGRSHINPNSSQSDDAKNSSSSFLNDSSEVLRGGGSSDEDLPARNKSSSALKFTSPSEKSRLLSNLLSDIPSANPISNDHVETEDNVVLTSIDSIPMDMDISSELIETTDPTFFNNAECPVLSADEVKTLLDDSVSDVPVGSSTSSSAFVNRTTLSTICSQPAPMVATENVFSSNPNVVSQYISHPLQMPMMQPLIVRSPVIPFPAEPLMAVPQVQQPVPSNLVAASPVTYFSPIPEPSPTYCFPYQQYSPTIYRAPLLQSPSPLPYSLRVTMAMAGTIGSDQIVAGSMNAERVPRQKRSYQRKMVRCPKGMFATPKKPRCRLDKPGIRPEKPLVYRPRLDTSSGLNMPKSSLLSDIQGGNILKLGEPVKQRNKKSSNSSSVPTSQATSSHRNEQGEQQHATVQKEPSRSKPSNPADKTSVSPPKATADVVSLPQQPVNQLASLEQLIEYYSAKNNLTNEEKAIVRSIINKQMRNKQLPIPANHPTCEVGKPTTQETVTKPRAPKAKATKAKKRRSTSRANVTKPKKKAKEKPKEKKLIIKDCNKLLPPPSDGDTNQHSVLFDIYNNRRSCVDHRRKQPLTKILTSYNIFLGNIKTSSNKENALPPPPSNSKKTKEYPLLVYEIKSDDGYFAKGTDLQDLIDKLLVSAQECRSMQKGHSNSTALHTVMTSRAFLGVSHDAVRFIVEQLPGARHCSRYRAKYHKHKKIKEDISHINPHGCCRAEQYKGRSKPDMFGFLASKHRIPPSFQPDKNQQDDMVQLSNRRATSMEDLPMAMRFRHLKTFSKEAVGVYRSSIHGRGLYCKRDIQDGEMILEYTGQIIRKELTDKREKHYESKSIGCYMFRMDDFYVVDATLLGSAARFINHSCEPNCYSRIVHVEGKKHIVIFALRKIYRGEELTYDYKFPIEDEMHKITCNCGARNCRKFMN